MLAGLIRFEGLNMRFVLFGLFGVLGLALHLIIPAHKFNTRLNESILVAPIKHGLGYKMISVELSEVVVVGIHAKLHGTKIFLADGRPLAISRRFFSKKEINRFVDEILRRKELVQ